MTRLIKRDENVTLQEIEGSFRHIEGLSGISLEALQNMQSAMLEQPLDHCAILPSEIEGVCNEVSQSNVELTSAFADLRYQIKLLRQRLDALDGGAPQVDI